MLSRGTSAAPYDPAAQTRARAVQAQRLSSRQQPMPGNSSGNPAAMGPARQQPYAVVPPQPMGPPPPHPKQPIVAPQPMYPVRQGYLVAPPQMRTAPYPPAPPPAVAQPLPQPRPVPVPHGWNQPVYTNAMPHPSQWQQHPGGMAPPQQWQQPAYGPAMPGPSSLPMHPPPGPSFPVPILQPVQTMQVPANAGGMAGGPPNVCLWMPLVMTPDTAKEVLVHHVRTSSARMAMPPTGPQQPQPNAS